MRGCSALQRLLALTGLIDDNGLRCWRELPTVASTEPLAPDCVLSSRVGLQAQGRGRSGLKGLLTSRDATVAVSVSGQQGVGTTSVCFRSAHAERVCLSNEQQALLQQGRRQLLSE